MEEQDERDTSNTRVDAVASDKSGVATCTDGGGGFGDGSPSVVIAQVEEQKDETAVTAADVVVGLDEVDVVPSPPPAAGDADVSQNVIAAAEVVAPPPPPNTSSRTCPICQRVFHGSSVYIQSNLNRHMLTHSGERPYECSQCQSTFTTSSNLRRHMAAKHQLQQEKQRPGSQQADGEAESVRDAQEEVPVAMSAEGATFAQSTAAAVAPHHRSNASMMMIKKKRLRENTDRVGDFPCRFQCGVSFAWCATRTKHERLCSKRDERGGDGDGTGVADMIQNSAQPRDLNNNHQPMCNDGDDNDKAHHDHRHRHQPFVMPTTFTCSECGSILSNRSKLRRHKAYHCPFRVDESLVAEDDVVTPVSSGTPLFKFSSEAVTEDGFMKVVVESSSASSSSSSDDYDELWENSNAVGVAVPLLNIHQQRQQLLGILNDPPLAARKHKRALIPCSCCHGMFRNHRLLMTHMQRRHKSNTTTTTITTTNCEAVTSSESSTQRRQDHSAAVVVAGDAADVVVVAVSPLLSETTTKNNSSNAALGSSPTSTWRGQAQRVPMLRQRSRQMKELLDEVGCGVHDDDGNDSGCDSGWVLSSGGEDGGGGGGGEQGERTQHMIECTGNASAIAPGPINDDRLLESII